MYFHLHDAYIWERKIKPPTNVCLSLQCVFSIILYTDENSGRSETLRSLRIALCKITPGHYSTDCLKVSGFTRKGLTVHIKMVGLSRPTLALFCRQFWGRVLIDWTKCILIFICVCDHLQIKLKVLRTKCLHVCVILPFFISFFFVCLFGVFVCVSNGPTGRLEAMQGTINHSQVNMWQWVVLYIFNCPW